MATVHQPLRNQCRPRRDRKTTLLATDEFWRSPPVVADAAPSVAPTTAEDDDRDDGSHAIMIMLPPAHHQLLSQERASYERLKGYDHTRRKVIGYDDIIHDGGYNSDETSFRRPSVMKRKGFAGLDDSIAPERYMDAPPGLFRSLLDSDECSLTSSETDDDSLGYPEAADDDDDKPPTRGGRVSFFETVVVRAIPHSCTLSHLQRRRMYTTLDKMRRNKARSKKEYRHDGFDWRNAAEEWEMGVDMVTGELVHPAHEHPWSE